MHRRPVLKIAGIAPLLLTLSGILPAYGAVERVGFQWVSPYDASGNGALPNVPIPPPPAPRQNYQSPEIISPVVIDGSRPSMPPSSYAAPSYTPSTGAGSYLAAPNAAPSPSPAAQSGAVPAYIPAPTSGAPPVVVSGNPPNSGTPIDMSAPSSGAAGYNQSGNAMNGSVPVISGAAPVIDGSGYGESLISSSQGAVVPAMPPMMPAPLPSQSGLPASGPSASEAPPSSGDVVQGFANQVPLAVALRQLLPPGYGFSIDQNVDLGTLVSFRGGRPWRETLRDALQPAGLAMQEQGQMVTIAHGDKMAAAAAPPPMAAAASSAQAPAAAQTASQTHYLQPPAKPSVNPPGNPPAINVEPVVMPPAASITAGNTPALQSWTADRGETLHKILEEWSRRANVEFEWLSEYDYPVQASFAFTGTFEEAVRDLLSGFEVAHPQPIAELHANPNLGQMVLIIQTRGNNYSD